MKRSTLFYYIPLAVIILVASCTTQTPLEGTTIATDASLLDVGTTTFSTPMPITSATTIIELVATPTRDEPTIFPSSAPATQLIETIEPTDTPNAPREDQSGPLNAVLLYYGSDGHLYRASLLRGVGERLTTQPLEGADDPDAVASIVSHRPPRVSPDGLWLALNGNWGGMAALNLTTGEPIGVGRGRAMLAPSWSPDSQYLAYLTQDDRLCIHDFSGGPDNCPFQSIGLQDAIWSPSGSTIAVAVVDPLAEGSADCCTGKVWLVDAFSGEAVEVGAYATGFESVPGESIAWLADGSGLVIKKTDTGQGAIYRLADQTIAGFPEPILSILPDGRFILHPSGIVRNVETGAMFPLIGVGDCAGTPSLPHAWSSDGAWLAYTPLCTAEGVTSPGPDTLYVVEMASGEVLWQQELPEALSLVDWSPDGEYILLNNSGVPPSIWRIRVDGTGEPELVVEDGYLLTVVGAWE